MDENRAINTGRDQGHDDTSPYRSVFRDAGYDPGVMVNKPLEVQNRVIRQQMIDRFKLKDVVSTLSPLETRNYLSDLYHNAAAWAHVMELPYGAVGLDGRITLRVLPPNPKRNWLGVYNLGDKSITISGRANSFAHEWTHAMDHMWAERLLGSPTAQKIFSEMPRVSAQTWTPGSATEAFAKVLGTLYGKDAKTALDALRAAHVLADENASVAARQTAAAALARIENEFSKHSRDYGFTTGGAEDAAYYNRPAEMLARAHEAYAAFRLNSSGYDTRGIARADPVYSAEGKAAITAQFARAYPKLDDRLKIFQSMDQLYEAMRRDQILGTDPAARAPSKLDIADPSRWSEMADMARAGQANVSWWKQEVRALQNLGDQLRERMGLDPSRPKAPPGHDATGWAQGLGKAVGYSTRGYIKGIIKRQSPQVQRLLQREILDRLAPAEGLRSPKLAQDRFIGATYERRESDLYKENINKFDDIMTGHGIGERSPQRMQLHEVLTGGDTTGIPQNVIDAAGEIRKLFADVHYGLRQPDVGIELGHADSYAPRVLDRAKVYNDSKEFKNDAAKEYEHVYDKEITTREDMLSEARKLADPNGKSLKYNHGSTYITTAGRDMINDLIKTERQRAAKARQVQAASDPNHPNHSKLGQFRQELSALTAQANSLHQSVEPVVRRAWAHGEAEEWRKAVTVGAPNDFSTVGPRSDPIRGRRLTGSADQILRKWYVTDPYSSIPNYLKSTSRLQAFAEHFGVGGSKLNDTLNKAEDAGMHPLDVKALRSVVEDMTGQAKSEIPDEIIRGVNVAHSLGSMALMPRAWFTALAEPMAAIATTGRARAGLEIYAGQIGDLFRTARSKDLDKLARAAGITTSPMFETVYHNRMGAHYADDPSWGRITSNYYRRVGLTQVTNSQRRQTMATGHLMMDTWSQDLLHGTAKEKYEAAAQFRDLGLPDAVHQDFAEWMQQQGARLPTPAELRSPGGQAWQQAVGELVDRTIQVTRRIDKPVMSNNPVGKLGVWLNGVQL